MILIAIEYNFFMMSSLYVSKLSIFIERIKNTITYIELSRGKYAKKALVLS